MTFRSWKQITEERWTVHLTNRREKIKWIRTFCRRLHRQFFHLFGYLSPQTLLWFSTFSCFVQYNIAFFDEFFFFFLLFFCWFFYFHIEIIRLANCEWFAGLSEFFCGILYFMWADIGCWWWYIHWYTYYLQKNQIYWLIGEKKAKVCWNSSNYIKDWRHDNA